jgi:hypothetical protein
VDGVIAVFAAVWLSDAMQSKGALAIVDLNEDTKEGAIETNTPH